MRASILLGVLCLIAACSAQSNVVPQDPADAEAPPAQAESNPNGTISYVLTYSQNITEAALQAKCANLNCTRVIYGIVKAIVVEQDPTAISTLSVDPLLNAASENVQVSLHYNEVNKTLPRTIASVDPPWHLDRINQFALPLDGQYNSNLTGNGIHIYMIDTGIEADHPEFLSADGSGSRVISGEWSFDNTNNTADCNGHGTATASLAGGRTLGSAPNSTLHAIRAVSCDGQAQIADIIGALNYIALNAIQPAVVSMSVGTTDLSDTLQLAVNNSVSIYNLTIIAAAGNDGTDACTATPGRSVYVAAVGATDINDQRPAFSNHGKCVNVYAPGDDVICAMPGKTYGFDSGTSMSCPIVAGVAAQYYEYDHGLKYYQIIDLIFKSRSRGNSPVADPPIVNIPICVTDADDDFDTDMNGKTCPTGYL